MICRKTIHGTAFAVSVFSVAFLAGCGGGGTAGTSIADTSTTVSNVTAASIYNGGASVTAPSAPIQVVQPPASPIPVTQTEVTALPAYNLSEYVSVVDTVAVTYPQVSQDSDQGRRVIVDTIRTNFSSQTGHLRRGPRLSFQQLANTTPEERWLILFHIPSAITTAGAADDALRMAQNAFPGTTPHNNKADAFRHALWNIYMSKRVSPQWAEQYGNAHESAPDNPPNEKAMDLHNNAIGRRIYGQYSAHEELPLLVDLIRYQNQYPYVQFSQPSEIGNTDSLVYLSE